MASRNLTPVYGNLGIPVMGNARIPAAGSFDLGWTLHWASHSVRESGGNRVLEYDGETQRHDLRVDVGLGKGFGAFVSLPYVRHLGGSFDSLIDGWHDFWGLPDGARPEQPQDALRYLLNGSDGFLLDDDVSGLGDVELGLSARLLERENWTLSAVAQVKLDTGDVEDFTGSGDTSYSVGLRYSSGHCLVASLSCHLQAGVTDLGSSSFDPGMDEQTVYAGVSIAWELLPQLALLAQLDIHEEIYQREPLAENGTPLWGTLGFRWQPAQGWAIDAHFSEDLSVGTAPDVTFLLGVRRGL